METLEERYDRLSKEVSDINEHLGTLREYASRVDRVTEFGVRHAVSTTALLHAQPKTLTCYDIVRQPNVDEIERLAAESETKFQFVLFNTGRIRINETDMLFIDTKHTYDQLFTEIKNNAEMVTTYLAFHDTATYGPHGEGGGKGLNQAIQDAIPWAEWKTVLFDVNNNGLTILERMFRGRNR